MNERIAKRLGWFSRNNVSTWYSTPLGTRTATPPDFSVDSTEMRGVWHGMRGVIETLRDKGELDAFTEALKVRAMKTRKTKKIMSVLDFGAYCLTATPAELTAAFIIMLEEEDNVEEG